MKIYLAEEIDRLQELGQEFIWIKMVRYLFLLKLSLWTSIDRFSQQWR